jgi:hypothetical protein
MSRILRHMISTVDTPSLYILRNINYRVGQKVKIKVKVKLSLCLNGAPRHEGVLGEWRYSFTHSLTSALDGSKWSVSRPGRFTSRERAPGTHWIGGWMGPRAILDAVVKRKIPSPRRESNPSPSIGNINVDVKLFLRLTKYHATKTYSNTHS